MCEGCVQSSARVCCACWAKLFCLGCIGWIEQQSNMEKRNMRALTQHSSAAEGFIQAQIWLIIIKTVQREELANYWRWRELNTGWRRPCGPQDVGKVNVSKPLLCGRSTSHAWAVFCFLPLSGLFTTFSWVKCRITTLLNIIEKELNEGRNSGCRTAHVCTETCIIAACWAKMLNHKWGTGKEKQLDIAPLGACADPTVTPAWQDQKYLPSALPYCYDEELINTEVSAFPSLFALLFW